MYYSGLVSISFRDSSPEDIIESASKSCLKYIEWGSDIHAPCNDTAQLEYISSLQRKHEIYCCSYGTYFRLGHSPIVELQHYLHAAKVLGTNIVRVWAGRKKAEDFTYEERCYLFEQCRLAAELAEKQNIILCLECHRRSYTETFEGALELMKHVSSPNFKMYWQPNPEISLQKNLEYITALQQYIMHIHVFNWKNTQKLPLSEGLQEWTQYLSALKGNHYLLLEFMPDDLIQSLPTEAKTLQYLIHVTQNDTIQHQDEIHRQ